MELGSGDFAAVGLGAAHTAEPDAEPKPPAAELTFGKLIETEQSRQTIFIPESEAELRRVFEEGLEGWRVFLHPEQRKIAYRDYNGPFLVRGGAGTGKTEFFRHMAYLMHRPGAVVSRSELTEHLYAQDFDRDSNTIEVFVGRLRRKLPEGSIETVRGLGYRLVATP